MGRLIALGLLVGCLAGCGDRIPDEAVELRRLTAPPNGEAFPAIVVRAERRDEVSWIIQTDWAWPRYVAWVQQRLPDGYVRSAGDEPEVSFERRTSGEMFTIRPIDGDAQVRVRATFARARM